MLLEHIALIADATFEGLHKENSVLGAGLSVLCKQ